jgi:DNA-binding NtrC family response regulator
VQPSDLLTVGPHAFRFTSEPLWTPTLPADAVGGMIGNSEAMRKVYGSARRMALHDDVNVLIGGPTGTGKELLARAIHDLSPRAAGPFIPINCAELSEELVESTLFGHAKGAFTGATHGAVGAFRAAEGGTLFLDEFGTLSLPMQAKLLRALADRSVRRVGEATSDIVNTRVVIATNVDLVRAVKEGTFREDLLYRICALVIHMPPLTSRTDDIPLLARWFLAQRFPSVGLSESAIARLLDHPWPGNVRELFQVLTAAAVAVQDRGQVIRPEHIVFIEEIYALAKVAPPPVFGGDVRTLAPKPLSDLTEQEWRAERTLLSERERCDMRGVKRGTVRYWDQVHQARAAGLPQPPRRRKKKRIPGLEDEE